MTLFDRRNRDRTHQARETYARYEIAHTAVDFIASISFFAGSILFLWPAYENAAIWLFILGSVFFMAKPTLRLIREVHLYRMNKIDTLAQRDGA